MTAIAPPRTPLSSMPPDGEQHFVVDGLTWTDYETIGAIFQDRPGLRLTYDSGRLEFMTTSPEHERHKHWLGRFVEVMAEEFSKPIAPYGSMTFKQRGLDKGLEPDQCYWIEHELQMRGKMDWDPETDPPPDLALEIEISRNVLNRMRIYAAFRIPQVWRFDGEKIRVNLLGPDGNYQESAASPTFPGVPLEEVVRFLQPNPSMDYFSIVREFRAWVREHMAKSAPKP